MRTGICDQRHPFKSNQEYPRPIVSCGRFDLGWQFRHVRIPLDLGLGSQSSDGGRAECRDFACKKTTTFAPTAEKESGNTTAPIALYAPQNNQSGCPDCQTYHEQESPFVKSLSVENAMAIGQDEGLRPSPS
jgi:hypothetical protein